MKKKGTKRLNRHSITFGDEVDSLVIALAKIRGSTKLIMRETGLSECQVIYRLGKAQGLEGRTGGYRMGFSNGTSPEWKRIRADYAGVFQAEIRRTLPQKINHPTPQTVKEPHAETADERKARLNAIKAKYEEEIRNSQ